MGKGLKNRNLDDAQRNKAKGRRDGKSATPKSAQRERNVGHKGAEEHSKKPKGGSGRWTRSR